MHLRWDGRSSKFSTSAWIVTILDKKLNVQIYTTEKQTNVYIFYMMTIILALERDKHED